MRDRHDLHYKTLPCYCLSDITFIIITLIQNYLNIEYDFLKNSNSPNCVNLSTKYI